MMQADPELEVFTEAVDLPDEDIDLARAALAVARVEYPALDPAPILQELDRMAARVQAQAGPGLRLVDQVEALLRVVLRERQLRGADTENYYDPRNSLINDVLERREGIPIALGILLISVGARAGIALAGTSMPLHFVVRVLGLAEPLFIDPHEGGRMLSHDGCRSLLMSLSQGRMTLEARMLEVISNAEVLTRLLTNLKLIYLDSGRLDQALRMLDRLLVLSPEAPGLLRERGLTRYRMQDRDGARTDLEAYLVVAENPPDAAQIRNLLRQIG